MRCFSIFVIYFVSVLDAYSNKIEGFETRKLSHSESSFLIPENWKAKSKIDDVLDIYLFAPKVEDEGFAYEMGFLVMVYKGVGKNSGSKPSSLAKDIKSWVINTRKGKLIKSGPKTSGPFHGAIAIHESHSHRIHEMHLGLDDKDLLWMMSFRAPKENWEENWKRYGFPIFKNISLDDEY